MIESTQIMYVARSPRPLPADEMQFHLWGGGVPTPEGIISALAEKGYVIIGYMSDQPVPALYDVTGKLMPGEGTREGDLVVAGPRALSLLPANRAKFDRRPVITPIIAPPADELLIVPSMGEEGVRTA